ANDLGNEGRILVRPSGTEPLIRVMVEAKTDELCAQYVKRVTDFLEENDF
ncbi:MAG: phosphoglucosamine mutase, partial [Holdemanella porci]|nr:phosphoglucosamine mutase [Holdemanella porci]